jgi:hypothetical protein
MVFEADFFLVFVYKYLNLGSPERQAIDSADILPNSGQVDN